MGRSSVTIRQPAKRPPPLGSSSPIPSTFGPFSKAHPEFGSNQSRPITSDRSSRHHRSSRANTPGKPDGPAYEPETGQPKEPLLKNETKVDKGKTHYKGDEEAQHQELARLHQIRNTKTLLYNHICSRHPALQGIRSIDDVFLPDAASERRGYKWQCNNWYKMPPREYNFGVGGVKSLSLFTNEEHLALARALEDGSLQCILTDPIPDDEEYDPADDKREGSTQPVQLARPRRGRPPATGKGSNPGSLPPKKRAGDRHYTTMKNFLFGIIEKALPGRIHGPDEVSFAESVTKSFGYVWVFKNGYKFPLKAGRIKNPRHYTAQERKELQNAVEDGSLEAVSTDDSTSTSRDGPEAHTSAKRTPEVIELDFSDASDFSGTEDGDGNVMRACKRDSKDGMLMEQPPTDSQNPSICHTTTPQSSSPVLTGTKRKWSSNNGSLGQPITLSPGPAKASQPPGDQRSSVNAASLRSRHSASQQALLQHLQSKLPDLSLTLNNVVTEPRNIYKWDCSGGYQLPCVHNAQSPNIKDLPAFTLEEHEELLDALEEGRLKAVSWPEGEVPPKRQRRTRPGQGNHRIDEEEPAPQPSSEDTMQPDAQSFLTSTLTQQLTIQQLQEELQTSQLCTQRLQEQLRVTQLGMHHLQEREKVLISLIQSGGREAGEIPVSTFSQYTFRFADRLRLKPLRLTSTVLEDSISLEFACGEKRGGCMMMLERED
ncbi:hypothetical protein BJ508DRAFT_360079 [Ascobolus immersus RN42]|uniref:Uncharacterized protein n=1 Tax=Ascobolus immersus RN42 TaxID=1160509 RepID=A0A3N4IIT4_ASCIM|nr:hypothetical protein BJ508DRAFT_360079 [Ascobolus immersus RN42]